MPASDLFFFHQSNDHLDVGVEKYFLARPCAFDSYVSKVFYFIFQGETNPNFQSPTGILQFNY